MWKYFDNLKFELIGLAIFYIVLLSESYGITIPYASFVLVTFVILFYLIKMFRSFKLSDWNRSKGATFLNFVLTLQFFCVVTGTAYLINQLPGGGELLHVSLLLPQYLIVMFAIALAIRWKKREIYWMITKVNILKMLAAVVVSLAFFYYFYDIPTYMRTKDDQHRGWIKLY